MGETGWYCCLHCSDKENRHREGKCLAEPGLECSSFNIPLCCLITEHCLSHKYCRISKNLRLSEKKDFYELKQTQTVKIFLD